MRSPIWHVNQERTIARVSKLHFGAMAEQFIGMTVSLTLSNNAQLRGTVSKVDSTTQILHLRDGILFSLPSFNSILTFFVR